MSRFLSYFKKEVDVHVDYLHSDGEKIPDTFNLYVIHKNKANMLTKLDWEEVNKVIEQLEAEEKPIQLWRQYGIGKEILDVPKWARKQLAEKLRETEREERRKLEPQVVSFSEMEKGDKKHLIGYPLLISGVAGSGKTYTIKQLIPELLEQGRRVAVVDFRDEYGELVEKHNGTSLTCEELHDIKSDFIRVHFGGDIFYHPAAYDLDFLSTLANQFDYLIIDDAVALYQDYFQFNLPESSNIYDVCTSLLKQNLGLNIILSLQSLSSLSEKDRTSLPKLISHHLLFRQVASELNNEQVELRVLGVGETAFFIGKKLKMFVNFKQKGDLMK